MTSATENPLLGDFTGPFGLPPFGSISPDHFGPAFEAALAEHKAEIAAIASNPEPANFANSLVAFEDSGRLLARIGAIFWNLSSAHTSDALKQIERTFAPRLAAHSAAIMTNGKLFKRIKSVYDDRAACGLTAEELRLVEQTFEAFVRAGAALAEDDKLRFNQISERLASLSTAFSQNVLADETDFELPLHTEEDLAGLPDYVRDGAASAATERGSSAPYVITLSRSLIEPFLTYSTRRDLRERAYEAWVARGGNGGKTDNRGIIAEILELRGEQARLLGFETFAHYKLDDTMAKTPERVQALLRRVWEPAVGRAREERQALEDFAKDEGANISLAAWDWWHYAEKVRAARYALKASDLKPYLPLEQMIDAAFYVAQRLFGLTFTPRPDLELYHPDARAWEVSDADGQHVGLFIGDYFARSSKRSGAWMSDYRDQEKLNGNTRPIIVNVCNFAKARKGQPALLSLDDVETLFHEFGHGLHGLLSDVTYRSLSGTSVEGDFVELPSQLYEHWVMTDDVIEKFARHYQTGEPMPRALIEKIQAAKTFNQGFGTVEYLASAIVDMAYHELADPSDIDPIEFEAETLRKLGTPAA
ncbi:MAG: M3 family metallopeptidase, partial [Rhizobiaceae bacterium]|nr:M3 family metallopeptidase [Rhizobiaceae bacterium]